jgi:hypothetical protein
MPRASARAPQLDLFLSDSAAYQAALARYEAVRPVLTGARSLHQQRACWVWANTGSGGRLDGGRISAVIRALLHNGGRPFSAPTACRFPPAPARRSGWPPPSP